MIKYYITFISFFLVFICIASGTYSQNQLIGSFKSVSEDTGRVWSIYDSAFSPDGAKIVFGGGKDSPEIWDLLTGDKIIQLDSEEPRSVIESVVFSYNSSYVISGGHSRKVRVWDSKTGKKIHEFIHPTTPNGGVSEVYAVAINQSGSIVAGSLIDDIALWNLDTGELIDQFESGILAIITEIHFLNDDKQLYIASSFSNRSMIVDLQTKENKNPFGTDFFRINSDSSKLIRIGVDGLLKEADAIMGNIVRNTNFALSNSVRLNGFQMSSDGNLLLLNSKDLRQVFLQSTSQASSTVPLRSFSVSDGREVSKTKFSRNGDKISILGKRTIDNNGIVTVNDQIDVYDISDLSASIRGFRKLE